MDKKGVEKFKKEAEEVVAGIKRLQAEIERYKTGAESFETATGILAEVARQQEEITEKLKEYIVGLYDIDTEKLMDTLKEMEGLTKTLGRQTEMANKTTGELLPMVNDLWGMTEDLEKNTEKAVGEMKGIGERLENIEIGYTEIRKELERRAREEGEIRERIEEGKIWIDRLTEKMSKMEGVAQRIENAEKRIEEKVKALK